MRILKIAHCFPPESMSGSEIYAYNLAKNLSDRHKVTIFYRIKDISSENYKVIKGNYDGIEIYKINNTLKQYYSPCDIYKNSSIEEKFERVLDEVDPDIVHIHHLLFLSLGIIDVIKKRGIPVIFTLHDYWLMCPRGQLLKADLKICNDPKNANCLFCLIAGLRPGSLLKKIITFRIPEKISARYDAGLKNVFDKVDLFIAPSNYLRNRFIGWGIDGRKIIYSDYGMNKDLLKDIFKTKSDKIRIGFIGTLIPAKGAHVLIKAFNEINDDKAVLKIYGKPPFNNGIFSYYDRLKRSAKRNPNISFMGQFDNKDVGRIFKEIDVLVFPSIWQENSPLILHEAILSETAVIAADTGGVAELVRDRTCLFARGDHEDLFNKIKIFITNHRLGKKPYYIEMGVKDIKEDSIEIEKIYIDILQKKHIT